MAYSIGMFLAKLVSATRAGCRHAAHLRRMQWHVRLALPLLSIPPPRTATGLIFLVGHILPDNSYTILSTALLNLQLPPQITPHLACR